MPTIPEIFFRLVNLETKYKELEKEIDAIKDGFEPIKDFSHEGILDCLRDISKNLEKLNKIS